MGVSRRCRLIAAIAAALALTGSPARAEERLWEALRTGGTLLLMRHAQTEPGTGDPPGFTLSECSTQRNLSPAGRAQAQRIGALLRERGVAVAEARSSRWCRCLETARLAFGEARPWPMIDSLFRDAGPRAAQRAAVLELARATRAPRNVALVTHAVNIAAYADVMPAMGEIVAVRAAAGRLEVLGRIPAP